MPSFINGENNVFSLYQNPDDRTLINIAVASNISDVVGTVKTKDLSDVIHEKIVAATSSTRITISNTGSFLHVHSSASDEEDYFPLSKIRF